MNPAVAYTIAGLVAASTLYGAFRLFGRRTRRPESVELGPPAPELQVLSRTPVGFGRSLVVVEFEGRRILLGVTRGQWSALADLGRVSLDQEPGAAIDAELSRAIRADRFRRGRKSS